MADYYKTDQITLIDLSDNKIEKQYDEGFVFTRLGKGVMNQTRSLRIKLTKFEFTSENRRVLKHVEGLQLSSKNLPLSEDDYDWKIAKLAKTFYESKFGKNVFSANKTKELLTDYSKSNFNSLLIYQYNNEKVGYVICYETESISHYAYPFYDFEKYNNNFGMGMMLMAINRAKNENREYFYLGSATKPTDKYKLQFKGLEWFDGSGWSTDLEIIKEKILP